MDNVWTDWEDLKKEPLEDPEFRATVEALAPFFDRSPSPEPRLGPGLPTFRFGSNLCQADDHETDVPQATGTFRQID
jgi:hypothetical protein